MASYKDLLILLRRGESPAEIVRQLGVRPSWLRRLMESKRLKEQLKLEEDIAAEVTAHRTAVGIYEMVNRLIELAHSSSPEASRRAACDLLAEGLQAGGAAGHKPPHRSRNPMAILLQDAPDK